MKKIINPIILTSIAAICIAAGSKLAIFLIDYLLTNQLIKIGNSVAMFVTLIIVAILGLIISIGCLINLIRLIANHINFIRLKVPIKVLGLSLLSGFIFGLLYKILVITVIKAMFLILL